MACRRPRDATGVDVVGALDALEEVDPFHPVESPSDEVAPRPAHAGDVVHA
jgi:hypothetical protein